MTSKIILAGILALLPAIAHAGSPGPAVAAAGEVSLASTARLCAAGCYAIPRTAPGAAAAIRTHAASSATAPRANAVTARSIEEDGERQLDALIAKLD